MMNPITRQDHKEYKEAQQKLNKEPQWEEFLNLEKKQYLNFRVSVNKQMLILISNFTMSSNPRMIFETGQGHVSNAVNPYHGSQKGRQKKSSQK